MYRYAIVDTICNVLQKLKAALAEAAPKGLNMYFENVGKINIIPHFACAHYYHSRVLI